MQLLLLTLISEFLGTVVTFGSSSFFVPLILPLYGVTATLATVSLLHVISNFLKIFTFRGGISWKVIILFGLPAIFFTALGAYLTIYVDSSLFKLLLGLAMIFGIILEIYTEKIKLLITRPIYIFGGALSGFLTGLVGTGGAFRGIFLLMLNVDKNVMIASSAFVDFWEDIIRLVIYWRNGYFTPEIWSNWYLLLIGSILGIFLARFSINKMSNKFFRKIVLYSLLILAVYNIYSYFFY